ncbi:hypothetical protein MKX07_004027 [Trichoderma sp. CBMAI-0711]|nr:hypothetical protein MKX07_004027 [Trichoderma sp. CBMAI-0711]
MLIFSYSALIVRIIGNASRLQDFSRDFYSSTEPLIQEYITLFQFNAMADSSQAHYVVYRIECQFNKTSRHSAIYVAMDSHGAGQLLHVRCAVGRPGMLFERQFFVSNGPESLATFVYKIPVGKVRVEDVDRLTEVCYTIAPPAMQYIGDVCQCGAWVNEACLEFRIAGLLFE